MGDLDGRVLIVTGGASYVGEAIGAAALEAGATVVLADSDADQGSGVASRLGEGARFVPTDVANDDDLDRLVATAVDGFGRLDGLVIRRGIENVVKPALGLSETLVLT